MLYCMMPSCWAGGGGAQTTASSLAHPRPSCPALPPCAGGRPDGLRQRGADHCVHAQRALRLLQTARPVSAVQACACWMTSSMRLWAQLCRSVWSFKFVLSVSPGFTPASSWPGLQRREPYQLPACTAFHIDPTAAPLLPLLAARRRAMRRARSSLCPSRTTSRCCMCTSSGRRTATAPTGVTSTSCRCAIQSTLSCSWVLLWWAGAASSACLALLHCIYSVLRFVLNGLPQPARPAGVKCRRKAEPRTPSFAHPHSLHRKGLKAAKPLHPTSLTVHAPQHLARTRPCPCSPPAAQGPEEGQGGAHPAAGHHAAAQGAHRQRRHRLGHRAQGAALLLAGCFVLSLPAGWRGRRGVAGGALVAACAQVRASCSVCAWPLRCQPPPLNGSLPGQVLPVYRLLLCVRMMRVC